MNENSISQLEEVIQYTFCKKELLKNAIRHSSYVNEQKNQDIKDNERLEFLGDAVLELVVSEYLYKEHPQMPEGQMTKLRASIVCESTLFLCARKFQLGKYLQLGKGEELTGGRERASVVSDAMEALTGAIYLDGGFEPAKRFIHQFILKHTEQIQLFCDSKTILQELVQSKNAAPLEYILVGESGPDHNKTFAVQAMWGECCIGQGTGRTKKAAEQEAAYQAVLKLKGTMSQKTTEE